MIGEPVVKPAELNRQLGELGLEPTQENRQRLRTLLFRVWEQGYLLGEPMVPVLNPYRPEP